MSRPLVRSELVGAELVWLLSVTYAGRVFRWSTSPVDLTDDDGAPIYFDGGMDPVEIEDGVRLLSTGIEDLSIPFDVVFPVDVALWIQRGHPLAESAAEVAVMIQGGTYQERRVVLLGTLTQPTYGAEYEPVSFSVERPPWDDRALIPTAKQKVNASSPSSQQGRWFPLVFGTPGAFTWASGTATVTSGSPAIVLTVSGDDAATLLIAGHWVDAANVRIYDAGGAGENFAVTNTTNSSGRIATVDVSAASTVNLESDDWWVGWNDGGGMLNDTHDAPRSGAGEVLEWALRQSTIPIDRVRWSLARPTLDRFKLSGYIDEPVSPWEWLADNVLPLLPVSVRSGPAGSFPVVFQYDATSADAVESVTAGAGFVRVGSVVYPNAATDLVNEIRIEFANRARTSEPYRLVTVGPEVWDSDDPDTVPNYFAKVSKTRHGVRSTIISTDIVYDTSTAMAIGQWMARAKSLAVREVTYESSHEFGWLVPGDVVLLTDAELHLDEHLVHVLSVSWQPSGLAITFLIPDDPPRDTRPSG